MCYQASWQNFANTASPANMTITARSPLKFCERSGSQSKHIFDLSPISQVFLESEDLQARTSLCIMENVIVLTYIKLCSCHILCSFNVSEKMHSMMSRWAVLVGSFISHVHGRIGEQIYRPMLKKPIDNNKC